MSKSITSGPPEFAAAFAALIASRSEQCVPSQVASSTSSDDVTLKVATAYAGAGTSQPVFPGSTNSGIPSVIPCGPLVTSLAFRITSRTASDAAEGVGEQVQHGDRGIVQREHARRGHEVEIEAVGGHGTFRPRAEVEDDPSWKQVIPYLLLRDGERIFLMKRTKAGADARLHDRYSIGVGGHVNPEDGDVMGGLRREWAEELDADFTPDFEPLGLLNDDSNPVGAVHLGLVFVADAQGRPVSVRETNKLSGQFATLDEVSAEVARLEEFIHANLQDAITLEGMAELLGMGVWTFNRQLRRTRSRRARRSRNGRR